MSPDDLTLGVLREIRDGVRTTNEKLDQTRVELKAEIAETNHRLDETNHRLDETNHRLDSVETTLKDLAGQQLMLTRYVKNVVERHDGAIDELRERVTRLETRLDNQ